MSKEDKEKLDIYRNNLKAGIYPFGWEAQELQALIIKEFLEKKDVNQERRSN